MTADTGGTVRAPVTHYMDDDWNPLCHADWKKDTMWAFDDESITCPECRTLLDSSDA